MFAVGVHDNARRVGVARNVSGLVSVPPHYTTRHSSHHLTLLTHNILRCTIQTCTHTHSTYTHLTHVTRTHRSHACRGHTHAHVPERESCPSDRMTKQDWQQMMWSRSVAWHRDVHGWLTFKWKGIVYNFYITQWPRQGVCIGYYMNEVLYDIPSLLRMGVCV